MKKLFFTLIFAATVANAQPEQYRVNIYDSRTEPGKSVVEVCLGDDCVSIIVDTKEFDDPKNVNKISRKVIEIVKARRKQRGY